MTVKDILLKFNTNLGNIEGNNIGISSTTDCMNYALDVVSKILFHINKPLFEEFGVVDLIPNTYDYDLELRDYTSFEYFNNENTTGTVIPVTTLRALSVLGVDLTNLTDTVGTNFLYTIYNNKYYFIINNTDFISKAGAKIRYFYNPYTPNYNQFQIRKVYDPSYTIPTADPDISNIDLDFIFKFTITDFIISEMLFRYKTNVKNEAETELDLIQKQDRKTNLINSFQSPLTPFIKTEVNFLS